ncbi:MAG: N-acetyl sugar amidotransferase [Bacteroidetes bacterium]|nr:N-acetyl sugar amidotransferase [Bacteroidota bacterium]
MIKSVSDPGYLQCSISVLDNIADPNITFDEKGISNYYYDYLKEEKKTVRTGEEGKRVLDSIIADIKAYGKGKKYDCITGVSGGVDSTYLALQAKQLGLRPLIVHFDNGWNSELAVMNIENIISRLGFDLYTLVVDWEEFKDIQLSFLKASVVDIEAITDHAIIGTLYKLAAENDIQYILSGSNIVTEFVLPKYWIWSKYDSLNIKSIHKQFGSVPLKTFPFLSGRQVHYYTKVKKIQTLSLLNYLPYNKAEVKKTITRELGWRDYGGKHYESVFTRFYQGYILPKKFLIDKRKAHLSNLIFAGQMSKDDALKELATPIYDPEQLKIDYDFVLKKFGMKDDEFKKILSLPRKEHNDYPHQKNNIWDSYPLIRPFKKIWRMFK